MYYTGRHHVTVSYCMCYSKIEKLLELKLWPAIPFSPQVAFTINLIP